jgi:antitoxin (DNA-binding transcriptional repressor) of toxin-antitoxin stability system
MQTMTINEFATNFPEVLNRINLGEKVGISHEDNIPVLMVVPYNLNEKVRNLEYEKPLFAETRGMWIGRDIDIKKIRKERRERRTKYYDNATL